MIDFKVKENLESMNREKKFYDQLKKLKKISILVGIPEERGKRRKRREMNNATLLFIHTKGSPLNGLPPRPLIEPALTAPDNAQKIDEDFKKVVLAALENNFDQAKRFMGIAGQDAVNMIRNWFDDPRNGWEPDKPETIKAKLRKTKKKLPERQQLFESYVAGDQEINTTLVDTGQLRKAITYIFREEGND